MLPRDRARAPKEAVRRNESAAFGLNNYYGLNLSSTKLDKFLFQFAPLIRVCSLCDPIFLAEPTDLVSPPLVGPSLIPVSSEI